MVILRSDKNHTFGGVSLLTLFLLLLLLLSNIVTAFRFHNDYHHNPRAGKTTMSMSSSELTAAEVRCHTKTSEFSAVILPKKEDGDNDVVVSWVYTRGRLEKGSGDSGNDLVVMRKGGFPQVVLSGIAGLSSGAVFSPDGTFFAVQTKDALLLGNTDDLTTRPWVKLAAGERFTGRPTWIKEDGILFGVHGGAPKRDRLYTAAAEQQQRQGPLFVAEHGGALLSWDHSQETTSGSGARVAIVHRLANAMMAEIVVVALDAAGHAVLPPAVVAVDCRQEYCQPQVGFLASGALLLRLNALLLDGDKHLRDAKALQTLPRDAPNGARHGLWVVDDFETPRLRPVDVLPGDGVMHGTYDCYSGMYGRPGAPEGFRMDRTRRRVVVTARRTGTTTTQDDGITYSDDLFRLELDGTDNNTLKATWAVDTKAQSGKGCKIPVAMGETSIVYHHRSPTESGDLWMIDNSSNNSHRLTKTMPLSLQRKLLVPIEVTILNKDAPRCTTEKPLPVHAQIFVPPKDICDGPLQPLLWLHGGPMAQYSFDCNPILSWLAGCGYLVMVPNFSGSTGNGIGFMNRVLAEGCGVADLSDCLACAAYLKSEEAKKREPRLDLSRGVGVGGHSWGGYLAFMCMLQKEKENDDESVFSCGVAAAGITDWFVQQRHTEVRYYDYALMGGWVYDKDVATRARGVSPVSTATELRAPLLVLHGDQDIDVPFQQIPAFVEAAKRSPHPGASVEYKAYEGEGHGMSGTETQADYLKRVKTFLRINLKPWDFTDNPHGEVTAY